MKIPKAIKLTLEQWDALKKRLEDANIDEKDLTFIKRMAELYTSLEKAVKEDNEEEMMRLLRLVTEIKP